MTDAKSSRPLSENQPDAPELGKSDRVAQYVLTYDLDTGKLVRVESIDARSGERLELSLEGLIRAWYQWYYSGLPWYFFHPFWYSLYQPKPGPAGVGGK